MTWLVQCVLAQSDTLFCLPRTARAWGVAAHVPTSCCSSWHSLALGALWQHAPGCQAALGVCQGKLHAVNVQRASLHTRSSDGCHLVNNIAVC